MVAMATVRLCEEETEKLASKTLTFQEEAKVNQDQTWHSQTTILYTYSKVVHT